MEAALTFREGSLLKFFQVLQVVEEDAGQDDSSVVIAELAIFFPIVHVDNCGTSDPLR